MMGTQVQTDMKNHPETSRVAVVTGGAAGIGAAIVEQLASDGFVVGVADINGSAAAVLVNNAGIAGTFPLIDYPLDHWKRVVEINITGPLLCSQAAARLMRKANWGRIVNIASISGVRASVGRAAYGTSKAALIGFTRQMAVELAELGITANCVAPGPIDTPLTRDHHTPATRDAYHRTVPMKRYGQPSEIAATVGFLCSDGASYVNGQIIAVDGGFLAAGLLEI
jgi:3-oxoacyl-[acyl-carrier protein] reductase